VGAEVLHSAPFYPVDSAGRKAGFFVLALEIQNCIPRGGLRTQKKVDIIFSVQIFAVQASFIVVVIEN
jgi:hypothetical protein